MTFTLPLSLLVYPLVGLLIYFPCLNGEWIFDDGAAISLVQNQFKWSWAWLVGKRQYRPLTLISIACNKLWPGTRRSLHVTNVFLHAGTAFLVEQLAFHQGASHGLAFLAGLLCVVHPFGANSVGYIAARASILSGFCGVAAILAIIGGFWPLSILCFGAAFLAKEDGIAFGLLAFSVCLVTGNYIGASILAALGSSLILYQWDWFCEFLSRDGSVDMRKIGLPGAHPPLQNALTVLVENTLRLPFWMVGLSQSPYHGSGVKAPGFLRAFCALSILLIGSVGFWFLPPLRIPLLLIVIGPWLVYLLCPVPEQLAEYRNYASVAGFALFLAPIVSHFRFGWLVILPLFAGWTWILARNWKGPLSMWTAAAMHTSGDPSRAYGEIGVYWKLQNELTAAEFSLREALRLNPNFAPARDNLANVLADKGKLDQARKEMDECMRRNPLYSNGWESLGRICERQDNPNGAFHAYSRGLELEANDRWLNLLGMLFYKQNQPENAAKWFDEALAQKPNEPSYRHNRAMVFAKTGNLQQGLDLVSVLGNYTFNPFDMLPPEAPR